MSTTLPATVPSFALATAMNRAEDIRPLVRLQSLTLTHDCMKHGLPQQLAELCAGLLASVVDDLVNIGQLKRTDFERTKRKQRILAAADEPARSALRIAVASSPINGFAAVAHWDAICEAHEVGKLAWLLGMETDAAYMYGKRYNRLERRQ